jgi:hypothetical protein
MTQIRTTLSLRLKENGRSPQDESAEILIRAIGHQLCVRSTYNRGLVILAPHILYTRNGDRFLDAVVIERNGGKPSDVKLGTFKLLGLNGVAMTSEPFKRFSGFDENAPRYAEVVIARLDS